MYCIRICEFFHLLYIKQASNYVRSEDHVTSIVVSLQSGSCTNELVLHFEIIATVEISSIQHIRENRIERKALFYVFSHYKDVI